MGLSYPAYLALIERSAADFGRVLQSSGAEVPVPSCPGWNLEDLTVHLGRVHRWAAANVRGERTDIGQAPVPERGDLGTWFSVGVGELLVAALCWIASRFWNCPGSGTL